jgi:hypothetical protein
MSLTSELRETYSMVRTFFRRWEDPTGRKDCLASLQSDQPLSLPPVPPLLKLHFATAGTAIDYLIRYMANGNRLVFEETIAYGIMQAAKKRGSRRARWLEDLFTLATSGLDGRSATDPGAVYSATALTVIDNYYRSGFFPQTFDSMHDTELRDQRKRLGITKLVRRVAYAQLANCERELRNGKTVASSKRLQVSTDEAIALKLPTVPGRKRYLVNLEVVTSAIQNALVPPSTQTLFDNFYSNTLGGHVFAEDVAQLARIYQHSASSQDGDLYGITMDTTNRSLANSELVGGADFDCILKVGDALILTEFKATTKRLTTDHLRQILGYALLIDEERDELCPTHVGVYHVRSGSFRCMPMSDLIHKALPGLRTIQNARAKFVKPLRVEHERRLKRYGLATSR